MTCLTALPLSIQSHILSYLVTHEPLRTRTQRWKTPFWLPFRDPPVTIPLTGAETQTIPLPSELLAPALASPILAAAAANLLGARVRYLTTANTGGRLTTWVAAFAPHVNAISTRDPFRDWWVRFQLQEEWDKVFDVQRRDSMQLLKVLSGNSVRLEVLDLVDVPFFACKDMDDDLVAGLYTALESSSATLRELALPLFTTSYITDTALEMSTLKRLEVLTVKLLPTLPAPFRTASKVSPNPFLRMIRAVDGHADRSQKLTTLRELRLMSAISIGLPFNNHLTRSDRSASVFLTVKTLRVGIPRFLQDPDGWNSRFLFLFKNLERLFLSANPLPTDECFTKLCEKVLEVHLCGSRWLNSVQVGASEHDAEKSFLFCDVADGRTSGFRTIRTFVTTFAYPAELRKIIKYCPSLEYLSLYITPGNTYTVGKLLRKCQEMKGLELVLSERRHGRLKAEGWRLLSRAIPKVHKNLCQIAIQTDDMFAKKARCVGAVVMCLRQVVKALGSQARRIAFRVALAPRNGVMVIPEICELLNTFIHHTPALESLELNLRIDNCKIEPCEPEWEAWIPAYMIHLENRLLREVPSLRVLDLGVWHGIGNPLYWNYNIVDMVPIGSDETRVDGDDRCREPSN